MRIAFLLLPQAGVAYAYRSFHQTVASTLLSGSDILEPGLAPFALLVAVVGVLTLLVNFVIAAALLSTATKLDTSDDSGQIAVGTRSADRWTPGSNPLRKLSNTPFSRQFGQRSAPQPVGPVTPRRAEYTNRQTSHL